MPVLRPLHSGWTLRAAGPAPLGDGPVPATVPGCVHTDLLARRADPGSVPGRERAPAAPGSAAPPGCTRPPSTPLTADDRVDLVSEGLDTVATVTLNGVALGRTANMHRGYRFDVRDAAASRAPTCCEVRFDSAVRVRRGGSATRLGDRPDAVRPSRSSSSARWPATSAGTGARPWSPPASGGRSAWSRGRWRGSPRSGRWSPSTAPTAGSTCTSRSSGPATSR